MLQGIGGGSFDASQLRSLFSKIDSDGSGSVTREEFVNGAPKDVSSEMAGQLFDALDSSGSGSLSESDILSAFEQLDSQMQGALIQEQGQGSRPQPPKPEDVFNQADSDGDGTVTREEFIANRPDEVSEEQAGSMFDQLDSEGTGSLSKEDFIAAMEANQPEPPPMASSQGTQLSQSLLELLKSYKNYGSSASSDETTTSVST